MKIPYTILFILIFNASLSMSAYPQPLGKTNQEKLRQGIISVFGRYIELNEDFKSSVSSGKGISGKPYKVLRAEAEKYGEDAYNPKLELLKEMVCKHKDEELLSKFFEVLISTENSADEYPTWILGDIYLCQSDLVILTFNKLEKAHQKIIYDDLSFGFANVTYNKEGR